MTTQRPRARFVPTLTEVIRPAGGAQDASAPESEGSPGGKNVSSKRNMLEGMVEDMMPQAREQLRQSLHAAAYAIAEEQLHAMEEHLRQQLRTALRDAAGMGKSVGAPQQPD